MEKTFKIIRCSVCASEDIDTDSETYFKCKVCGFEWEVIKEKESIKDASNEKTLLEEQNKNKAKKKT